MDEEAFKTLTIADIWRVVYHYRWMVVICTLIGLTIGILYSTLRRPRYESVGILEITAQTNSLLNLGASELTGGMTGDTQTRLETQTRIMKSDDLAATVMTELKMYDFAQLNSSGTRGSNLFETPSPSDADNTLTPLQRERSLAKFRDGLTVKVLPNTELLEVRFRDTDPAMSAKVTNALLRTYVRRNFQSHYRAAMDISDWISRQLEDVRRSAEESQKALVALQRKSGLLGTSENENTVIDRLRQLNEQLTNAQADRIVKEARYQMLRSQSADLVSTATNDATLQMLRSREAELNIQLAQLSAKFGNGYPPLRETRSELSDIESSISREIERASSRITNEYNTAKETEATLRAQYEAQEQAAYSLNSDASQFAILQSQVQSSRDLYEALQLRLREAGISAGLSSSNTTIVQFAAPASKPVEPVFWLDILVSTLGAALLSLVMAYLFMSLDSTIHDIADAEQISGISALGIIPELLSTAHNAAELPPELRAPALIAAARPKLDVSESFRALRSALLLLRAGGTGKIISITSTLPGEGKSFVSANLAIVLAQTGRKVLLVSADLRRPSIERLLAISSADRARGLSRILSSRESIDSGIVHLDMIPGLDVLTCGPVPPYPSELLQSERMHEVMEEMRQKYDSVVVDSPPASVVTDPLIIASLSDVRLLVVRFGMVTKTSLVETSRTVARANVRFDGLVLNGIDSGTMNYYYGGYGYYRSPYYTEDEITKGA